MTDQEAVKQLLLRSKAEAQKQIDRIYDCCPLSFETLEVCLTDYILEKFMLSREEAEDVDFQKLSELSLAKSMKISRELVREFDTARSCAGATSAIAKKTLLYMSIQKALKIELAAEKTPKVHTFGEFTSLVWEAMAQSAWWMPRLVTENRP